MATERPMPELSQSVSWRKQGIGTAFDAETVTWNPEVEVINVLRQHVSEEIRHTLLQ